VVEYPNFANILDIHVDIMRRLGTAPQSLLREGDIRSALGRPHWVAHYNAADLIRQAARLTTGIARAHGFVDGNKRTSYAALLVFLGLNGYGLSGQRIDIGPLIVRLAGPSVGDTEADEQMEIFLRERVVSRYPDQSPELGSGRPGYLA
jgi:death-on-curing protein